MERYCVFTRGSLPWGRLVVAGCLAVVVPAVSSGQEATAKRTYSSVIGEVTGIDTSAGKLTLKQDNGSTAEVTLSPETTYMSVPPGEKDLKKAARISLTDIQTGDRVLARSPKTESANTAATSVIVMSKTAIAQHQEKTREEWQRRGVAGKVKSVDPATKTVTISIQTPSGLKDFTVETDDRTTFRRYAPDSVRFADAKVSKFADLAPGNNLRALGEKSADGNRIHAEEVVSGSFQNIAGTVVSVDAANKELKLTDMSTRKPVVVKVNSDTTLKKLPPNVAMMLVRMRQASANPAGGAGTTPGPQTAGNQPTPNRPEGAAAQGGPTDSAPRQHAGAGEPNGEHRWNGGGRLDMNQMLEKMPALSLSDLKPGDALIVSSTRGEDPSRVTAITVVAGVDPLLAAAPSAARQGNLGGEWNFDIGMPQ